MKKALRFCLLFTVLFSCIGCDQISKSVARKSLSSSASTSLFNDFIRLEYVENPGAFLSLGSEQPGGFRFLLFVVGTGALLILLPFLVLLKERNITLTKLMGLALVMGGGIGNLIDRIINDGQVVDFVSLGIGALRTGIFNMADVVIMGGVLLLLAGLLRNTENPISNPL